MPRSRLASHTPHQGDSVSGISRADTAAYIKDMLDSLANIAERQGELVLARLIETAAGEAGRTARRELTSGL
jgi:hypothetical protein